MAGSPPNFYKMDSRSACIQSVLKVKVKIKGHVRRALSWVLGMSYSVIDGLVPKQLGIFQPNFTCLLFVPIYARLWIFIQLSTTLTKLCHVKRDHPVHIMCAKCPPSAEMHAGIFWLKIPNRCGKMSENFRGGDFFWLTLYTLHTFLLYDNAFSM